MNNERNHLLTDTDSGICAQQPVMGMPARHTNEEIRESGAMPYMVKAMEHDISDAPAVDPVAAYKAVENGVVGAYKAVEKGAGCGKRGYRCRMSAWHSAVTKNSA